MPIARANQRRAARNALRSQCATAAVIAGAIRKLPLQELLDEQRALGLPEPEPSDMAVLQILERAQRELFALRAEPAHA